MSEDEIEIGARGAGCFDLGDPLILHAAGERGAEIEEEAQGLGVFAGVEKLDGVEAVGGFEFAAHVVVHGGEAGGVAGAFERFEIKLGEIDAIPIEAADEVFDSGGGSAEAIAIGQVHELAPIELGVLQKGGFFAPLGMRGPEFTADVGQLDPGVNQDAVTVAGFD